MREEVQFSARNCEEVSMQKTEEFARLIYLHLLRCPGRLARGIPKVLPYPK
jgi:hypothetical protein